MVPGELRSHAHEWNDWHHLALHLPYIAAADPELRSGPNPLKFLPRQRVGEKRACTADRRHESNVNFKRACRMTKVESQSTAKVFPARRSHRSHAAFPPEWILQADEISHKRHNQTQIQPSSMQATPTTATLASGQTVRPRTVLRTEPRRKLDWVLPSSQMFLADRSRNKLMGAVPDAAPN